MLSYFLGATLIVQELIGTIKHSYVPVSFKEKLLEVAEDFHFEQLVTTPTRGPNVLDLCFVSHPDLFTLCQTAPGISDHDSIIVKFSTQN